MTTITMPDPNGSIDQTNCTVVARYSSLKVPNGAEVQKIGLFSTSARTYGVKLVKHIDTATFEIVVSHSFVHPGGGWADFILPSPYTVPSSGDFYPAMHTGSGGNVNTFSGTPRHVKIGDFGLGVHSGFTSTTGQVIPMRVVFDEAQVTVPGGGSDPEDPELLPPGLDDDGTLTEMFGVIRKSNNVWSLINDGGHKPKNLASVGVVNGGSAGGYVEIHYATPAAKVGTFIATPDETYAQQGVVCGCSVGFTSAKLKFWKNGAAVSPNSMTEGLSNIWLFGRMWNVA